MRRFGILALAGTLAVAAAPAQAGSVQQTSSLKKVSILSAQEGAFTASGRALCPAGQASTPFAAVSRTHPDGSIDLVVIKRFVCDDGSGMFEMTLHVRLKIVSPGTFQNTFRWLISDGTGRYEHLEGLGTGAPQIGGPLELYTGRVGTSKDD